MFLTTPERESGYVPVSFELYPLREPSREEALYDTIQQLAAAQPEFISVTYQAGGSTGGRSLQLLRYLLTHTEVEPLAHLTCVGNTYAGAARLVREFLDAGIRHFLALRGDPPADGQPFSGDLESAAQLVQLIDLVQAERAPYVEQPVPGMPGAVRVGPRSRVEVAVAAFPNGHPRDRRPFQDVEALLAKQAAGATFAITQLFFHPDDYLAFVARARHAGVTIPILPGIMPITSLSRLKRVLGLTGEAVPSELAIALEIEPDIEGRRQIGIRWSAELARAVVDGGAPGIHLYAYNQHRTVLDVLAAADIARPTHSLPSKGIS